MVLSEVAGGLAKTCTWLCGDSESPPPLGDRMAPASPDAERCEPASMEPCGSEEYLSEVGSIHELADLSRIDWPADGDVAMLSSPQVRTPPVESVDAFVAADEAAGLAAAGVASAEKARVEAPVRLAFDSAQESRAEAFAVHEDSDDESTGEDHAHFEFQFELMNTLPREQALAVVERLRRADRERARSKALLRKVEELTVELESKVDRANAAALEVALAATERQDKPASEHASESSSSLRALVRGTDDDCDHDVVQSVGHENVLANSSERSRPLGRSLLRHLFDLIVSVLIFYFLLVHPNGRALMLMTLDVREPIGSHAWVANHSLCLFTEELPLASSVEAAQEFCALDTEATSPAVRSRSDSSKPKPLAAWRSPATPEAMVASAELRASEERLHPAQGASELRSLEEDSAVADILREHDGLLNSTSLPLSSPGEAPEPAEDGKSEEEEGEEWQEAKHLEASFLGETTAGGPPTGETKAEKEREATEDLESTNGVAEGFSDTRVEAEEAFSQPTLDMLVPHRFISRFQRRPRSFSPRLAASAPLLQEPREQIAVVAATFGLVLLAHWLPSPSTSRERKASSRLRMTARS
eukprot:TRINITY_DN20559_c0_g3_i2.p1 TRINITY_DN20559_c0_g3~~TRINITY_DN20559_c0_g3_i2.p1  ORF type:complete len:614 (+),score=128.62 TRINITY_DN20559_c0_g3_i2:74-1843(+)